MTCLKKYQSSEEAVEDHKKNYNSRGDAKGKYKPDAPDAKRIKYIRDQIPDGSTVLDIGCNDGGLGVLLQKRGCVVFGVDCVKQLVKISVAKGLLAHVGEAENLPFDDEKFERVVLAEVLEHLFDPLKGLREIHRVLQPEGVFVGSVPHNVGNMGEGKKADYHHWVFSQDDLRKLLTTFFENIEIVETPYSEQFCIEENIDPTVPQWYNFKAWGKK